MATPRVAVVCDSTASLTAEEAAADSFSIVPLDVVIAGRAVEETELSPEALLTALRSRRPVTTSRPSPARFAAAYARLAAAGAQQIVSLHLSEATSGTCAAARLAAESAGLPVQVIDTGQLAMGLGYPVLTAARVARAGRSAQDVVSVAVACAERTRVYFAVDTLEYLRRGGRVSLAGAMLGSALSVKPLLAVREGRVDIQERVRTTARAMDRLVELTVAEAAQWDAPTGALAATVQHLGNPGRADALAIRLAEALSIEVDVRPVSAVVGAHVGPGVVGVALTPC